MVILEYFNHHLSILIMHETKSKIYQTRIKIIWLKPWSVVLGQSQTMRCCSYMVSKIFILVYLIKAESQYINNVVNSVSNIFNNIWKYLTRKIGKVNDGTGNIGDWEMMKCLLNYFFYAMHEAGWWWNKWYIWLIKNHNITYILSNYIKRPSKIQ